MADPANLLSTPDGYATPEQIKAINEYAKVLRTSAQQSPVKHWAQGVSNIVNALVGGDLSNYAASREKEGYSSASQALPEAPGGPPGETPFTHSSAEGGGDVVPTRAAFNLVNGAGGGDLIDRSKSAIGGIESGNRYDAEGPVITSGPMKGKKAIGRYQVMEPNIGPWTLAHYGKELTPEEFKATPAAQDAVYKGQFGEYAKKYGPTGAAKAWFAGEGGMNNPNAHDQLGTTVASYANKFDRAMGGPQATTPAAMALDAEEAPSPAAAIMSKVLAKGGAPGGGPGPVVQSGPGAVPVIPGGLDPRLVPKRPQISRQQYEAIMRNPWVDPAMKAQTNQMYMEQFQPQRLPTTGGNLAVSPDGLIQQYFPDMGKAGVEAGDIKVPGAQMWNPATKRYELYPAEEPPKTLGLRSEIAPSVAPAPIPTAAQQSAGVDETKIPGLPGSAAAQAAGAQVASLDPAIGAGKPGEGGIEPIAAALTPPPGAEAPVKVAQNVNRMEQGQPGRPSLIPESVWNANKALKELGVETEGLKEGAKEMAKANVKHFQDSTIAAQQARDKLPLLDTAAELAKDDNFYTGFAGNGVLEWQRLKAGIAASPFGQLLSPEDKVAWEKSAQPNELFRKIVSGSILDGMKATLQGLGQVRVAEINLLEKANASPQNTVASNRALIEISRRQTQRQIMYDDIMQDYVAGSEVRDPLDPNKVLAPANVKNGEIVERIPDAKMRMVMRRFSEAHPAFTPEETKKFENIFAEDRKAKPAEAVKAPVIVKVQTPADAEKLAPGTSYETPDGRKFTR